MLRPLITFCLLLLLAVPVSANADSEEKPNDFSKPVAVRWWGQGMVSIESYWNLKVVIDPYHEGIGYKVPELTSDLLLVTHEHSDHNNVEAVAGQPTIFRGLDAEGNAVAVVGVLDRLANAERSSWKQPAQAEQQVVYPLSKNSILVKSIPAWHDNKQGAKRGAIGMFAIDVDGVRIVHCGDLGQTMLTDKQLAAIGKVDVLCLPVGGVYTIDGQQAVALIEQIKPRFVIPIHYKTDALTIPLEPIEPFLTAVGKRYEVERPVGNTFAVSAAKAGDKPATKIVVLHYKPWQPEGDLATLLMEMDIASRESQAVFTPLTTNLMNWRPSNGTHTPRWNAEHMMGRQLLFFTQIYAAIDSTFEPIDLNPQQMPSDYRAAHANWSGAEEAAQMQRANALVLRFAYLLDGLNLDKQAPGSRWKLRGLLEQMVRHFNEHTANVKQKFDLADWPKE